MAACDRKEDYIEPRSRVIAFSYLKVVVEKQKISTNGKMLDMTDRIRPEVQELMQNALALMKEGGHIPQELMSLGPDDLSLDTEELSASPLLCLKLRWVIADMLFGTCTDRDNVPESTMEKIIDADPFLGAHSEFKKAKGVKHVDDVKKGREQWTAVKTVGALVSMCAMPNLGD